MRPRRLVTVSHSYPVALNRRLAAELSRAGGTAWDVTAVSPRRYRGDLRDVTIEPAPGEPNHLRTVAAYATRFPHLFFYGPGLASILRGPWDCVHAWEEPYIVAGAQIAACTPRRVPLVFSTLQNISKRYPPPFAQFEKFVVSRSSGWIASGHTVAMVKRNAPGYAARPTVTIPLGVDVNAFVPDPSLRAGTRRDLGWSEAGPAVVGYLGRMVEGKGIPLLMAVLDGMKTPWRALFVGGGSLEPEVRSWAARYPDRVRLVTGVPHDDVPRYLNAMDVLCAPSETLPTWREQLGRMITEAFACGVPVVGSDSGEVPYTIGDAGLVLHEGDVVGWTRGLEALIDDVPRRAELSARGRERAVTQFSWPVVARRTLAFLAECCLTHETSGQPTSP